MATKLTPAQSRILESVKAGRITLRNNHRSGGMFWSDNGVRVSPATDRMLDRLADLKVISTRREDRFIVGMKVPTSMPVAYVL